LEGTGLAPTCFSTLNHKPSIHLMWLERPHLRESESKSKREREKKREREREGEREREREREKDRE